MNTKISLSYGQRRLWTLDRIEQSAATYNMPIALRLRGTIDTKALAQALRLIVERHESLRTLIVESESGQPVGMVAETPAAQELLAVTDLSVKSLSRLLTSQPSPPFERDCLRSMRKSMY